MRTTPQKHKPAEAPLGRYRAKRDFTRTPEPADPGERGEALGYVIHKHWASSLHYDLRLEIDGVMKSWAVPKGPSFDPKDKRMAVHVEDHPLSYAAFEGTIPAGQYGAGKVIVWDKGHWQPLGDARRDYEAGHLKFQIHGHKLHGRWVLVRMKDRSGRQDPWLLIKEKDDEARPAAEYSVVDEAPDSVAKLAMPKAAAAAKPATRARQSAAAKADTGVKAALPARLEPQLATLVAAPPADAADWLYEVKFDGYRLLARIADGEPRLLTRNGHDWTHRMTALAAELKRARLPDGWYDGEIIVPDDEGRPDFGALQRSFESKSANDIVYMLFDLPYVGGRDLRALPLEARRAHLEQLLSKRPSDSLRFSTAFDAPAGELVASACRLGLEGLIGKKRDSTYRSGRSRDWIKLKCSQRQEFVIGGYTEPQGSRAGFGALLLGVRNKSGGLDYAGNVGTGFDARLLRELKAKLDERAIDTSPFEQRVVAPGTRHWVEPSLVCEVSFGEWTRAGRIRHAVFRGLRSDKPAATIVKEMPAAPPEAPGTRKAAAPLRIKVTHGERVVDAQSGITKIELVRYYGLVGELMMGHLKRRPVSLVRAPDGVGGELFFQKHIDVSKLAGLRTSACGGSAPAIEVASRDGLLAAAQWNAVELHTANMTAADCAHPDRMIFDLDPGEGVAWAQVQEGAQLLHSLLDQLGLPAFLKTSGGKGLHVVVPIRRQLDFDGVKAFSQAIVQHMAHTIPQRFVAKSGPRNRVGKIFIDYLRNGEAATTVCAWSARARPGMGISVPVGWDELHDLKSADQWTVRNVHTRLDRGDAPWVGYAKAARAIGPAMRRLGFEPDAKA